MAELERPNKELALRYWNDPALKAWYWSSAHDYWFQEPRPWFSDDRTWHVGHEAPTEPPVRMCELAGVKFPMPIEKEPELGAVIWVACATGLVSRTVFLAVEQDRAWLVARLLHTNEVAAQAHSKALHAANQQAIEGAK